MTKRFLEVFNKLRIELPLYVSQSGYDHQSFQLYRERELEDLRARDRLAADIAIKLLELEQNNQTVDNSDEDDDGRIVLKYIKEANNKLVDENGMIWSATKDMYRQNRYMLDVGSSDGEFYIYGDVYESKLILDPFHSALYSQFITMLERSQKGENE